MNSRQRRKLEAKKHNDLLIEEEAYREDRLRDPAKYKRNVNTKSRRTLAATAIIMGATIGFNK